MRKKIGISIVVLFAVALAVAAFFIQKDKKVVVVDPWLAVPSDAVFIVETPDFPELLTKVTDRNGLISRLGEMRWAARILEDAGLIDSITGGREIREMMTGKKVLLSFHVVGQGRMVPLAVMNVGPSVTLKRLNQMVQKMGATSSDIREFGGARALSATFGKGQKKMPVHMAITSGIVIVSPSDILIANAVNNRNTGSDIRHQQGFTQVVEASGRDMENLYVLFRNIPRFAQGFVRPGEIGPLSSLAIAAGGDMTTKDDGLFISGFLATSGAGVGADKLKSIPPAETAVHEVLPEETVCYRSIMKRPGLSGEPTADPSAINATDIALALSPFTGDEVTTAIIPSDTSLVRVILFRMNDRQAAEKAVREKLTAKYRSMRLAESQYITRTTSDRSADESTIFRIPFTGVASALAGTQTNISDLFVTFCRSYMIFSSDSGILQRIINQSDNDNTMINDPAFREMEKTLPTKSSFLFYSAGEALRGIISEFVTGEAGNTLNERTFSAIRGVGISLSPSDEMVYASVSFIYRDKQEESETVMAGASSLQQETQQVPATSSDLIWKVKLVSNLSVRPFLFTNHNTGATEIFLQDEQNNIYLVSAGGKILWSAPVREAIRGEVFMIDYYRNGKNQLLFAGKDYIHLIDRNGKYVDKFPVKLRSPASNTLAVFDYENNKDYRLCIAGEDKKIYVYDRSGVPVRGWTPFTTKGRVSDQVSFFRVKGKDYLVIADDQAVFLLDRTGNIRVSLREQVVKAKKSALRLTRDNEPVLVCSSPDGTLVNILFDGTVKRYAGQQKFSENHSFDILDIDGDGADEYIFLDQGQLAVYDDNKSGIFSRTFETKDLRGPYKYIFSGSDKRLGVYDNGVKQIFLLNRNGVNAIGFPRTGGPMFTIGKLSGGSNWNFIMDGADGYLYNYGLSVGIN